MVDRRVGHAPCILGLRDVADDDDELAASTRYTVAEPIQPLAVDVARDDPRPDAKRGSNTMTETLPIAVAQFAPTADASGNLETIQQLVATASGRGWA